MMANGQVFDRAFHLVVGMEGGFTANTADPGNWTGGKCGSGTCVGTKYGISGASYPTLNIAGLDLDAAQQIYRRDYWDRIKGDALPPALALLVFDAAVNNGVGRSIRWLQQSLGVTADGVMGEGTLAAARRRNGEGGAALLAEFQAQRLIFMTGLPTWRTFGAGWARRLCRLPFDAVQMGGA